jgi:hypothetical protein
VGYYCPAGTDNPIPCPAGSYNNVTGKSTCSSCPAGFYCDGTRPTMYQSCPAGRYCPAGTGITVPRCPVGTYSSNTRLTSASDCTSCLAGKFCNAPGLTFPNGTCAAGFYCPTGSMDAKGMTSSAYDNRCPTGSYCPAGSANPLPCPAGTYNPTKSLSAK